MDINKKNVEIINEIMTLYIRYVNEHLTNDIKQINEKVSKNSLPIDMTYDQLNRDIVKISGQKYFEELKIERLE